MLKYPQVSKFRSEVIERAINIEFLMSMIISQHYFQDTQNKFVWEVLYDEYCSFAFKRRVLEKIIPNLDRQQLEKLNRVGTIRNCFAHCNQKFIDNETGKEGVVNPRKIDQMIDFEKLYREFLEVAAPLEKYLAQVYLDKGGRMDTQ